MTLTSVDYLTHNFFLDCSGDKIPSLSEPKSADFPMLPYRVPTTNYKFTASTVGTFKYYSEHDENTTIGTFTVSEPTIITTELGRKEATLNARSSINVTFTWNTTNLAKGNYTISSYTWPLQGEADTMDNTLTDGTVMTGVPCDLTSSKPSVPDDICKMRDIGEACANFGSTDP